MDRKSDRGRGGGLNAAIGACISLLAILGTILQGIRVEDQGYASGWLDWLSPFALLTGAGVVAGYALLGATWRAWKVEGSAQTHARLLALLIGIATLELECSQVIAARRLTQETGFIELAWERQRGPDQSGMRVTIGDKVVRLARL